MSLVKKTEFLYKLDALLNALPKADAKRSLDYYAEMIDERIECGMSEEDAVAELGSPCDLAAQILDNFSPEKQKRKHSVPAVILLILGSPVWLPLLISVFAIVLSLYVSLWAVIISLWAAFASVTVSVPAALIFGIGFMLEGIPISCVAIVGAGIALAGVAILLFIGCKYATIGAARLAKVVVLGAKSLFTKKEAA